MDEEERLKVERIASKNPFMYKVRVQSKHDPSHAFEYYYFTEKETKDKAATFEERLYDTFFTTEIPTIKLDLFTVLYPGIWHAGTHAESIRFHNSVERLIDRKNHMNVILD